ncbi:flagellar hook-basal body complex protein [Shumkonia mesophila]|uniref:flagellar hook-basal body complex protein n=1 Tax=Shumkonia mesophila TaxID=2838854 RepID=UPI002934338C|nr:flagellar hook-basal body complex protein [Shumkonia mesophila]
MFGIFSPSVLGMMSQTQALNTIGQNIANVSTGGYKGRDVRFSTLVGQQMDHESDLSGVRPWEYQRIDQQGLLQASASMMDLGINGRGFFVLSDTFDGSGHTFYGRDGSFQMNTVNDVSVTADDGSTITVKDGYLADKNGYFVLGWEADANGTFPTSGGSLQPMRIDSYAFSNSFVPTTTGILGVNLPANAATGSRENYTVSMVDSAGNQQAVAFAFRKSHVANQWLMTAQTDGVATAQVDTATLSGTPEAGDIYSVTVNGSVISHTVATNQTDTATLSGTLEAGDQYTVTINGTPITYTVPGFQQDTVTFSGTPVLGDSYSIEIDGNLFSHPVVPGDTLSTIRDDLIAQINALPALSGVVTAVPSGAAGVTVTADVANTPFLMTPGAVDGGGPADNAFATATAQLVTATMTDVRDDLVNQINTTLGAVVNATAVGTDGLSVTADVPGTPFTLVGSTPTVGFTPDNAIATVSASPAQTITEIRDALMAQINSTTFNNGIVAATVTAVAAGTDGMTITADDAGLPFSLSANAVDGGVTADNAIATTTTATVLTFSEHGEIDTPANVALALNFAGGATATVALDVTDMTQYAGDFTPINYSRNGFAACNMEGFRFDENGVVSGIFEDGTTRVLYKVPLAVFSNPNDLEEKNGNVFSPTSESGDPQIVAAGSVGAGDFMPNSRELSNVDIAEEFSMMIMTQNAYNSSAQVFKTIDEMTAVARDLKR